MNPITEIRQIDRANRMTRLLPKKAGLPGLIESAIASTTKNLDVFDSAEELAKVSNCSAASGLLFMLVDAVLLNLAILADDEFQLLADIEAKDWPTPDEARETRLYLLRNTGEFGAYTVAKGPDDVSRMWEAIA